VTWRFVLPPRVTRSSGADRYKLFDCSLRGAEEFCWRLYDRRGLKRGGGWCSAIISVPFAIDGGNRQMAAGYLAIA
jgi:hypothetical protein